MPRKRRPDPLACLETGEVYTSKLWTTGVPNPNWVPHQCVFALRYEGLNHDDDLTFRAYYVATEMWGSGTFTIDQLRQAKCRPFREVERKIIVEEREPESAAQEVIFA